MNFDLRHLVDPEHIVLMEVALLHAAAVDRDRPFQRRRETECDAALNLLLDAGGIHYLAAIHRADHAMDPEFPCFHGYLRDLRRKAADIVGEGDAPPVTFRQRLAPSRLVSSEIQNGEQTRILSDETARQFQRILAARRRNSSMKLSMKNVFCE